MPFLPVSISNRKCGEISASSDNLSLFYGKITDVGEIMGYSLDMDKIE